jgi:mannose-6-phosphate isomerase
MQAFPTSAVPGRLHGVVHHYAWGSRTSIARLQGRTVPTELPEAELWFGAHEQAPSMLEHDGRRVPLDRVVADDPVGTLGARLAAGPARLPFLVKVLAAAEPLSLQLHPDAAQAAEGFAAEEAAGIPRAADQRRFRDPWPKPEVLVALEPFSALCGLRSAAEVVEILDRLAVVALAPVVARLRAHGDDGYGAAIADLLRLDRPERAALVTDLAVAARREHALLGPMAEVVADLATRYPSDAGVGVALLLRHHELAPGDALAVAPGVPHAYLHGTGLEVMGASDNVLRGGLTTKHVDVDEFCRLLATDTSLPTTADAALDRVDQVGPQRRRRDDPVTLPTSSARSTEWIAVELLGDLTELLRAHRRAQLASSARSRAASAASSAAVAAMRSRVGDARVGVGAAVDLAGEHDRRGRWTADDRRVEPSTAATSMSSLSAAENTTNAPPW